MKGVAPLPVTIGVLALQGDVAEHAAMIRRCGADPREVRRPSDLEGLAGLVIPGGESTTLGKLMTRVGLDEAIKERVAQGMALYGTCAGLILMAVDIEGSTQPRLGLLDVGVSRNAYGRQVDSFETDITGGWFGNQPFRAVFIRAPKVTRVGEGVEVLAEYDGAPVWVRQGSLMATSFHPELTTDDRVHRFFVEMASR